MLANAAVAGPSPAGVCGVEQAMLPETRSAPLGRMASRPTLTEALTALPIMPISLLCAVVCCLCGYVAFRLLQAYERHQTTTQSPELPESVAAEEKEETAGPAAVKPQQHSKDGVSVTPAPDTPNVTPERRLDSEDGASNAAVEPVAASGPSPEAGCVDPLRVPKVGSSFRLLGGGGSPERGLVAADVPDGERNYVWDDGAEYFGEWVDGRAQGRGVYSWPSGDRYEGEWEAGREDGVGTFISVDGSTFYGFWSHGKMHGEGVYKPATADHQVMFMREYEQGHLLKETVLRIKDYDLHRKELKRDQRARRTEKRQAAKDLALTRPGETIYKGHRSYDLMRNLQMGILFSIAKTNREISERDTTTQLQKTEVTQQFPRSGQSTSFKWKDYCPLVFHQLRQAFGIDNRDYLLSLTGDKALRELPSPGKSGSVFFISDDDRFMIKTVRKEEMRLLLDLVPKYYTHCIENPDTLLTRFYGVHRVKPIYGHHVRFVVMGNVFPTETRLHRKYDLKGSTHGRTAGPKRNEAGATLKDLDVDFRLQLKDTYYRQLMGQIEADAALLERMHVMDYSLLLGIHYVSGDDADPTYNGNDGRREPDSPTTPDGQGGNWDETYAAAEKDAVKYSPERASGETTIFNRWHSKRQMIMDEPFMRVMSSESAARAEDGSRRMQSPPTNSEAEIPSPTSSITSMSMTSTSCSTVRDRGLLQKVGSVEDLRAQLKHCIGIASPSGSWPSTSPHRPSRFALESTQQPHVRMAGTPATLRTLPGRQAISEGHLVTGASPQQRGPEMMACESSAPSLRGGPPGEDDQTETGSLRIESGSERIPSFLRLLSRVRLRHGPQEPPPKSALERSRSGWLRGEHEMTSLRSLHSEARRHMGVSIPALVHPLRPDGTADLDAKPLPVTLFFGIIDFLQDYNMRKRTEHVLKSLVQDGKAISVTNPHTYAQRFTRFMQNLFITVPSD